MTRLPLAFAFAAALGCVPPLDNPSHVHDLRILALATDPPEITYPVQSSGDGGILSELNCTPDFGPILSASPVTLSALVADPAGNGRTLHYVFTGCPGTGTQICPDGGGYVLASGDAPAPELTATWDVGAQANLELAVQQTCRPGATCAPTPLIDAFAGDPLGLCRFGVWFQVGLEVSADDPDGGTETIWGEKIMVFTPAPDDYPSTCPQGPDGGPPPRHNPVLEAYDLDGEALPLFYTPQVSASVAHTLRPAPPSDGPQQYCLPLYTGGWTNPPLIETWLYSAMTDVGQFDREQVGGADVAFGNGQQVSTDLNFTWTFPDGGGIGETANLWEITRDGRGGTAWIVRHASVIP